MNTLDFTGGGYAKRTPYSAPTLISLEITIEQGFAQSTEDALWGGNGEITDGDENSVGSY